MKKFFLLIAVMACCTFCVQAQQKDEDFLRHEIAVSYGAAPSSMWIHLFGDIIDAVAGSYDASSFTGPISAEYFYHTEPAVGLGGIFTFNQRHNDIMKSDTKMGERDRTYFTIMPAIKYDYLRTKNFGMYIKAAAGVTFGNDKETYQGKDDVKESDVFFNFQFSLLGLEAGSRNFRGYLEAGVGEHGMLQAGLRYKF